MTPASTKDAVEVELDIRCSDEDCRGRREDLGEKLLWGPNGCYCPYCRNFRFLLLRKNPVMKEPSRCYKCGLLEARGGCSICDKCLQPQLDELRKGGTSGQLEGDKGKD